MLQELAAARTSVVLPHPGGPERRTPFEGVSPYLRKASGCCKGQQIAYDIE